MFNHCNSSINILYDKYLSTIRADFSKEKSSLMNTRINTSNFNRYTSHIVTVNFNKLYIITCFNQC